MSSLGYDQRVGDTTHTVGLVNSSEVRVRDQSCRTKVAFSKAEECMLRDHHLSIYRPTFRCRHVVYILPPYPPNCQQPGSQPGPPPIGIGEEGRGRGDGLPLRSAPAHIPARCSEVRRSLMFPLTAPLLLCIGIAYGLGGLNSPLCESARCMGACLIKLPCPPLHIYQSHLPR